MKAQSLAQNPAQSLAMSGFARGAWLAMLAFGAFSTHDAIVKTLGASYSVFQIIFFGVLFAFVPVTGMLAADQALANLRPHHPWLVAARTLAMVVSMAGAFYAFTVLPLAETYALLFATPLLITALSVPILGETVRLRRWIAVLVGLLGVLIVLRPGYISFNLGHGAALLAALGASFSAIIVRRIGPEERSAVLVLYPMLANIMVMALVLPWVYVPMPLGDLGLAALIGFIAPVAQMLWIAAYRAAPAALIAPIQYSQILWAVPFGFFLFDDTPDRWVAAGAFLIIASGLFILWRETHDQVSDTQPTLRPRNARPDAGPSPRPTIKEHD
jgi:drug/metabolite transporter (DMT)-like permease